MCETKCKIILECGKHTCNKKVSERNFTLDFIMKQNYFFSAVMETVRAVKDLVIKRCPAVDTSASQNAIVECATLARTSRNSLASAD